MQRMRRVLGAVAITMAALAPSGCGGLGALNVPCYQDSDCENGDVCRAGSCVVQCVTDLECPDTAPTCRFNRCIGPPAADAGLTPPDLAFTPAVDAVVESVDAAPVAPDAAVAVTPDAAPVATPDAAAVATPDAALAVTPDAAAVGTPDAAPDATADAAAADAAPAVAPDAAASTP